MGKDKGKAMADSSSGSIRIRVAEVSDAEAILSLYYDLIDRMIQSPYRPTWEKNVYPTIDDIRNAAAAGTLYVAEAFDENESAGGSGNTEGSVSAASRAAGKPAVAGAVVCNRTQGPGYEQIPWAVDAPDDKVGVIHLLAVDPLRHRSGVATKLLERAAADSRAAGLSVLRLDTLPYNTPGRRLYESVGFVWRGDIPLFYPCCGEIPFSLYEKRL